MIEELLASFRRIPFSELDTAPEGPGLYAWYGQMRLGAGTWGMKIESGADVGEVHSRRALHRHSQQYASAPLLVNVESAFSSTWSGTLQDEGYCIMQTALENPLADPVLGIENSVAPKLQSTLASPRLRELLFKTLECSAPVLSSPLYIGVSENLRYRLHTHSHNIQLHRQRAHSNPRYYDNMSDPKVMGTFGFRAARQGFSADTLEVWILDLNEISGPEVSASQLREVAEACEWLLNRWHRPQLGRR